MFGMLQSLFDSKQLAVFLSGKYDGFFLSESKKLQDN